MGTQVSDVGVHPPEPCDRRQFLGGSDIAAMMGISPWKTPYDLWEEKTSETPITFTSDPEREKRYRRGKRLEPWVIEMLEEEQGIYVVCRNQVYFDQEHPWMRAEVDFEYQGDEGLCNGEIKTVSPFAAGEWGEAGTDEIPTYYAVQSLWGLGINGRPMTLVGSLIGADDLRVYLIRRDEELIAEIRRLAVEFWKDNVLAKVAPPPTTASDTQKILSKYGGFVCAGTAEVIEHVRRLEGIKAAVKRLDDAKGKYEFAIKEFITLQAEALGVGEGKKFVVNDVSGKKLITFAQQDRAGYEVKPTSFWVLR